MKSNETSLKRTIVIQAHKAQWGLLETELSQSTLDKGVVVNTIRFLPADSRLAE